MMFMNHLIYEQKHNIDLHNLLPYAVLSFTNI